MATISQVGYPACRPLLISQKLYRKIYFHILINNEYIFQVFDNCIIHREGKKESNVRLLCLRRKKWKPCLFVSVKCQSMFHSATLYHILQTLLLYYTTVYTHMDRSHRIKLTHFSQVFRFILKQVMLFKTNGRFSYKIQHWAVKKIDL